MFNSARKKLTAWYLLILMSVSISFSVAIYRGMSAEIDRFTQLQRIRVERRFDDAGIPRPPILLDLDVINEAKQHIVMSFLGINGIIFIVMGGLSYFLAGKTLQPIKEMIEEQNRFVSDASHELKTPLTAMKSALEVYLRDPKMTLQEARQVLVENIQEVNRLQTLSESLLTLSETQPNSSALLAQLNPKDIITKASALVRYNAEKKKIKIQISIIPKEKIKGREEKLVELFTILLDNAIKYSSQDSTIMIIGEIEKKGVELRVSDTGMGIEEKDIPHIFDRFYRSDKARGRRGVGGYGLGLSIAKKIVEFHRGKIKVESAINFGTTVSVWLPLV